MDKWTRVLLAYRGKAVSHTGKTTEYWVDIDGISRSWKKRICKHPTIGCWYSFHGEDVDEHMSIFPGTGEATGALHDDRDKWQATDRAARQVDELRKVAAKKALDSDLDYAIRIMADRMSALRTLPQRAAWWSWVSERIRKGAGQ